MIKYLKRLSHLYTLEGTPSLKHHLAAGITVGTPIYLYEQHKFNKLKKQEQERLSKSASLPTYASVPTHPCF